MQILLQGLPFFCDYSVLNLYAGNHEIRTISAKKTGNTHYSFSPHTENFAEVWSRICQEWVPDVFICWHPENDPPPRGVEHCPVLTIAIAGDWNLFYGIQKINLSRYDIVLCDKPGVDILKSEWINPHYVMPLYAANPLIHRVIPGNRDIDILYVGNMNFLHRQDRGWLLDRLAMLGDRYRISIVGGLFGEDYARALCRSKIVFNRSIRGELNLRVFETMACGALALIEDSNEEIYDWFTDGEDIVLYNNQNLEQKIIYYLEHDFERERIVARAFARINEFAPEKRLDKLIEFAISQKTNGRKFHELPPSEKLFQDYLQYSFRFEPEYYDIQEKIATEAIQLFPQDPRSWTILGQTFLRTPKEKIKNAHTHAKQCLKAFTQAVEFGGENAVFFFNGASACEYCGAKDLEPHFLRAVLLSTKNEYQEFLIGDYLKPFWTKWLYGLAKHTNSIEMLWAEACIRLAKHAADKGNLTEASTYLEKATELEPLNAEGIWLKSQLLWLTNKKREAAEFLLQHRKDFPLNKHYRLQLAAMFQELGDTNLAEKLTQEVVLIEKALDRSPFFPIQPYPNTETQNGSTTP